MASWIAYSLYVKEDKDRDKVQSKLLSNTPDRLIDFVKPQELHLVPHNEHPREKKTYDALYNKIGVSHQDAEHEVYDRLLEWFNFSASSIKVLYLTSVSNTSDSARINVYKPKNGKLKKIDERGGKIKFNQGSKYEDSQGYKVHFPEESAGVYPHAEGLDNYDETVNLLENFTAKYGGRPLIYY